MKERPILFSAPMVRAILAGKKTQTRRIVKPQPSTGNRLEWITNIVGRQPSFAETKPLSCDLVREVRCPYGTPGDRLWVKETHALVPWRSGAERHVPDQDHDAQGVRYRATWDKSNHARWRPSIHMPRWASRITLEITDVRVQRLQDISEADCWAEGIDEVDGMLDDAAICAAAKLAGCGYEDARATFAALWIEINGVDSWSADPWVWALTFRRVEVSP